MSFIVTTTGSFPPLGKNYTTSIQSVVDQQLKQGVDLLVDGQFGNDIVGIFAPSIGLQGNYLPYHVAGRIAGVPLSVNLPNLEIAAKAAANHPLKVHLTGPTIIAESCAPETLPEIYRGDDGFHALVLDLANVLADEAASVAQQANNLRVDYLQIDEPSLAFGADLELARQAIDIITQAWRQAGGGEVILHVCGDVRDILTSLATMPVDILNLENLFLREAEKKDLNTLWQNHKKVALGLIPVNTEKVPSVQRVARELVTAQSRYGTDHIWGITPNCGLRLSSPEKAAERLKTLVEAARIVKRRENEKRRV